MTKILVTHINPHLDDIAAIWLFKKFNPEFQNAPVKFLEATNGIASDPDSIYFGIGRGRYDEHKGDLEDCATSLVWSDFSSQSSGLEKAALEELVYWVKLGDTGKLSGSLDDEYSVPGFIRPRDNTQEGSLDALTLGEKILDRILENLKDKQQSILDWIRKIEVGTKLGKLTAIESGTVDRSFCKKQGGDVFLMYDPQSKYVQFFTPSQGKDLEPIYNKVKELDPSADWYLHHSHHMVLCGSGTAPNSKRTKLSFKELIKAVKDI